ncbi:MAG: GvpL/GvpF family gas vesicle protein [Acidimicrobiaceae bacterium]|nr:GvpL/GvpF family gas vesicle protein [Acidimicrobiaceae bacterium]
MRSMAPERCYVYGVIDRAEIPAVDAPNGIDDAPITTLEHGPVAAVCSRLGDERVRPSRAHLSAHERVVESVADRITIVPLQFGVVWPTEQAVVDQLLAPRTDMLAQVVADLGGKREHRVKVTYRGDTALREAVAANPDIRRLQQFIRKRGIAASYGARIELGELTVAALDRIRADDVKTITRRLSPYAAAAVLLPHRRDDVAVHAGFLVEEKRRRRFDRAVDAIANDHQHRMSFGVVGPLAPWDFVGEASAQVAPTGPRRG